MKQYADLRPDDFDRHPVWIACHTADYNEEWYDETDEETFRPYTGSLPVTAKEMYLVRCTFKLSDHSTMVGFATPADAKNAWDLIQPQIFLPGGQWVGVWFGMFPPQNAVKQFCESFGKEKESIFPIHFAADEGLTSAVCSGEISGLMKSGEPVFEVLSE